MRVFQSWLTIPVFEIKYEDGELTENGQVITGDPLDYLNHVTVKGETY